MIWRLLMASSIGGSLRSLATSFVLILLFTGFPVICVMASSTFARTLGCTLNEGDVHPCPFLGVDLGGALYALFVSGWFGLLTIPLGAALLLMWLAAAIVFAARRMRGV
jgi:hypothetical protein